MRACRVQNNKIFCESDEDDAEMCRNLVGLRAILNENDIIISKFLRNFEFPASLGVYIDKQVVEINNKMSTVCLRNGFLITRSVILYTLYIVANQSVCYFAQEFWILIPRLKLPQHSGYNGRREVKKSASQKTTNNASGEPVH